MSPELTKAVESLTLELNSILQKASEIKKTINQLYVMNNETPPYADVGFTAFGGIGNINEDQFFGMGVSTAVKEFLRMKGRAATAREIYEALQRGGFEFPEDWKDENQLKNLAISISKNRYDFCPVPLKDGSAYGLWDFYPDKKKEREKKLSSSNQSEKEGVEESVADKLINERIEQNKKDKKTKVIGNKLILNPENNPSKE